MPQICRTMTVFLIFSKQSESILIWIFKSISKLLSKFENVTNMTKFVIHKLISFWMKNLNWLNHSYFLRKIHGKIHQSQSSTIWILLIPAFYTEFPDNFFPQVISYMIGNFANILVNFTSKTGSIPRKSQKISKKKNNRVSHSQATFGQEKQVRSTTINPYILI